MCRVPVAADQAVPLGDPADRVVVREEAHQAVVMKTRDHHVKTAISWGQTSSAIALRILLILQPSIARFR